MYEQEGTPGYQEYLGELLRNRPDIAEAVSWHLSGSTEHSAEHPLLHNTAIRNSILQSPELGKAIAHKIYEAEKIEQASSQALGHPTPLLKRILEFRRDIFGPLQEGLTKDT